MGLKFTCFNVLNHKRVRGNQSLSAGNMKKYIAGGSATDAKRGKIWNRRTPKIRAGKLATRAKKKRVKTKQVTEEVMSFFFFLPRNIQ